MENSVKRLLEFVDSKGGIATVAEKIGVSKVLFYNYKNRGSMPNMGVLELLSNHYDEFDSEYVLKGVSRILLLQERVRSFEEQQNKWVTKMMENGNFNTVDTSNLFVDDINELSKLDEVTKAFWIGRAYLSDLTRND